MRDPRICRTARSPGSAVPAAGACGSGLIRICPSKRFMRSTSDAASPPSKPGPPGAGAQNHGRVSAVGRPAAAVLAIDGGNSKTDCALVAADGTLMSSIRGPGASAQHLGLEGPCGRSAGWS